MKRIFMTLIAGVLVAFGAQAAEELDIRKITNGTYSARGVGGMRSMNDGEHYMMIGGGGTCLVRYAFKTGDLQTLPLLYDLDECRRL